MKYNQFQIDTHVWQYPGMSGWHFLTIPKKTALEIDKEFSNLKRGWGSLPVNVKIGKTNWKTSIFPDKESGGYMLPLKSEVRKKESLKEGTKVCLFFEIVLT